MDVTFCEDWPFFPISHLQGKSASEEFNSTNPTPITLPYLTLILIPRSYLQTKFPEKLTIGEISKRKVSLLLISRLQSKTLNLLEIKV